MTFTKAWAVGHFDTPGEKYEINGDMNGSFTQYTNGLRKMDAKSVSIKMTSSKKGFLGFGWSEIGTMICNYNGDAGIIENGKGLCANKINNSGTKEILSVWTKNDSGTGYLVADIYRQ